MAGLSLMAGAGAGGGVRAAVPPSASGSTIGQHAYGITSGSPNPANGAKAGMGATAIGAISAAVLVWIWWTLPR